MTDLHLELARLWYPDMWGAILGRWYWRDSKRLSALVREARKRETMSDEERKAHRRAQRRASYHRNKMMNGMRGKYARTYVGKGAI